MTRTDGRQLLVETFPLTMPTKQMISESIKQHDGRMYLTGRLHHANLINGNGRVYPKWILQRQVKKYQQFINIGASLGQCDHPDSDQISLQNVAITQHCLKWNGDELLGTIMLTSNSVGRDMRALVQDGVSLSISSRGLGSLKKTKDGDQVQDDYDLIGWDLVLIPSTPDATFFNENSRKHVGESQGRVQQIRTPINQNKERLSHLVNEILNLL